MKVALVHYWLVGMRGGEKVLEALCDLYPQADIFTLVSDEEKLSPTIRAHKIHTSFLQKMGGVKRYKSLLPLMPMALESFDLTGYDLVISSEAGPAKGVITRPDALHICYCHSPMRYIWDLYPQYYKSAGRIAKAAMFLTSPALRAWDVTTAARVDYFIANSNYVADRIKKFYRRESHVINPPVELSRFSFSGSISDFYLCAGQITPYKKIEIAVEACKALDVPLVVCGAGADKRLRSIAGPKTKFVGAVSDREMECYFRECRALLFPGVEDFGIVPLELMASGRPVIAYARGGALETVIDGKTGILFEEQTVASLTRAIERFETQADTFDPEVLREFSKSFRNEIFKKKMLAYINDCLEKHKGRAYSVA